MCLYDRLNAGDLAYFDNAHHFYIVDRLKELIKVKGFQVVLPPDKFIWESNLQENWIPGV